MRILLCIVFSSSPHYRGRFKGSSSVPNFPSIAIGGQSLDGSIAFVCVQTLIAGRLLSELNVTTYRKCRHGPVPFLVGRRKEKRWQHLISHPTTVQRSERKFLGQAARPYTFRDTFLPSWQPSELRIDQSRATSYLQGVS
jgi:hypothetical protein